MELNFLLFNLRVCQDKKGCLRDSFIFVMAVNNRPLKTKFDIWKSFTYVHMCTQSTRKNFKNYVYECPTKSYYKGCIQNK